MAYRPKLRSHSLFQHHIPCSSILLLPLRIYYVLLGTYYLRVTRRNDRIRGPTGHELFLGEQTSLGQDQSNREQLTSVLPGELFRDLYDT